MNLKDSKGTLIAFRQKCKKFAGTLNSLAVWNLNYDDNDPNIKDSLDKNDSEWRNFVNEVNAYFKVYPNDGYYHKFQKIIAQNINIEAVNELDVLFNDCIINIDVGQVVQNKAETLASNADKVSRDSIFIIHGHDEAMKYDVARFIESLNLRPIILAEQPSGGKTIIEKIEYYVGMTGYAIALYSPCDEGRKIGEDKLNARARQNVILEHGILMGKLGRNRVCAIVKGDVEKPSDIDGVLYIKYSGNWKTDLVNELKQQGFNI